MDESVVPRVGGGIATACKENGCALLGGETAEMPDLYDKDESDLAGFIVGIFMHMAWERLALKLAILMPPIALMVLVWLMAYEADYTFLTRIVFFGEGAPLPVHH